MLVIVLGVMLEMVPGIMLDRMLELVGCCGYVK